LPSLTDFLFEEERRVKARVRTVKNTPRPQTTTAKESPLPTLSDLSLSHGEEEREMVELEGVVTEVREGKKEKIGWWDN